MGVHRGHTQGRLRAMRGGVTKGQLADERVDVGVLEERRERMPPALRGGGFLDAGFDARGMKESQMASVPTAPASRQTDRQSHAAAARANGSEAA